MDTSKDWTLRMISVKVRLFTLLAGFPPCIGESQNELLLPDKWVAYYPSDPSGIERRRRLVLARWRLASSLRIFEVRVGFVFRRIWGFCAALRISSTRRSVAS